MPTYDYRCPACGSAFERVSSFKDYQSLVGCECGQIAERVFTPNVNVVVKGMGEYKFDPRKCVTTIPKYKRSAEREMIHNEKVISTQRELTKARRAAGREKDGHEFLGCMPATMADSIGLHEGDKEAVYKDPIPFLKATGTYMGKDKK